MIMTRDALGRLRQFSGMNTKQEVEFVNNQQQAKAEIKKIGVTPTSPVFAVINGGVRND